ncbi:MAG TPA: DUF2813 domain-containing protein [Candidatus Acetothermia bacterium]|nr:DUF2813 domain-containing protein [Candidatus Acetothermia bacterium]
MIKRVRIQGYKSLHDLDLKLGKFCVLFGPNASGKSNFLDALQLLSGLIKSPTLNDAFKPPYRGAPLESFAFPEGGMKALLQQESATVRFEVDVELSDSTIISVDRLIREMRKTRLVKETAQPYGDQPKSQYVRERSLRYTLEVEILPKSGILRVRDERLCALNGSGVPKVSRNPFLEKVGQKLHLRMEKQSHPTYHDVNLDHSVLSLSLYPPHYPHVTAFKKELSNWSFFYFEPRDRMRRSSPIKEVRHIGLMGEDLAAFLNTLRAVSPRQLQGIEKTLHAIIPSVSGIEVEPNDLGEVELRIVEGNTSIPASVVSEGTLRILGLLALNASTEPATLVGFEEPENGVHPRRIRLIAELLKSRSEQADTQLIVTTHSPILPDMLSDEDLYVCRKAGGNTEIQPFSTWGELARDSTIQKALDEEQPSGVSIPVSQRILRGDFDA